MMASGGRWKNSWYIVPRHAIFRDIDPFGHVNNAVYDVGFIVVRAECDFHHQIAMAPIETRVRIGEMRTTSFDTLYEIRTAGGRQITATGRVVVVPFDWKTQAKGPITDELRKKVRLFQKEAE